MQQAGRTALHWAADSGQALCCDLLIQSKAFINSKTKQGLTPLHMAAERGHKDCMDILIIKHKAMLDAVTLDGRTPLHVAAKYGQIEITKALLALGANPNARDSKGQSPLHLAAESDYPDVVKIFLKMKPDISTLTATDENGFTCAHIAAMKGSVSVVRELMMIDKDMVISAQTKLTESTALHLAAAGGHRNAVKVLLDSGADAMAENANGMTPVHLAGKFGHIDILDVLDKNLWGYCSKKTGLTAVHVAAHFGQIEFVRYMLNVIPATIKSEPPQSANPLMVKELQTEYGLTLLHMAAQSGHEGLVRILLNSVGVSVDTPTVLQSVIPLHLAAQCGHVAVVGLLLSRSTAQLNIKDSKGRTSLHLAAMNGHYDMVSLLIGQGSSINAMDTNGFTALHFATKAGHAAVVKLLVGSGADPLAETRDGKVAVGFAAAYNHYPCLSFLLRHDHDTYLLMEDRKFVFDLMVCGKSNNYKPVEEFVLLSQAPIDTAVKLSSLYIEMSAKEKERAKDLEIVSEYCEDMAVELLAIASAESNPAVLLKAVDVRNRPFLDILIEHEQKKVVSHATVQRYLTEIWNGGIKWGDWKFITFFFFLTVFPPLWTIFSMPLDNHICRAPIIKFCCHLISHGYFTLLIVCEVLSIWQPIYEIQSIWPSWIEWFILLFLSGMLVSELSNPDSRSGLALVKIIILICSAFAVLVHILGYFVAFHDIFGEFQTTNDRDMSFQTYLYIRNQLFAVVNMFCFIDYLEFLTVHHLFGPWAIIIRDLMYDLSRFLVILSLFIAGFTLHVTSIFQPAFPSSDPSQARLANPLETLDMLFLSLFGLVEPDAMPLLHRYPDCAIAILKPAFPSSDPSQARLANPLETLEMLFFSLFGLVEPDAMPPLHHVPDCAIAILKPAFPSSDPSQARLANPLETLEMLFFSLFGLVEPDAMPPLHRVPDCAIAILKVVFGVYMMVTLIVLINLLIAMMSDTYQRIQARSDTEWKFGRAKLIRQMNKKSATPPPVNIFTKFYTVLKVASRNRCNLCSPKAQEDMRLEENIDSYDMPGNTGRSSPSPNKQGGDDDGGAKGNVETGIHGATVPIDSAVDWKQVVNTYFIYQGSANAEEMKETGGELVENYENEANQAAENK